MIQITPQMRILVGGRTRGFSEPSEGRFCNSIARLNNAPHQRVGRSN